MTIFLFNLLTAGGDRMAATDPHGWTLSLISVAIVFSALIILYFLYSLSGDIFSGKISFKKKNGKKGGKTVDSEIAAAIAMALEMECGGEAEAAVAMALHLYLSDSAHDYEPGIITIKKSTSPWSDKQLTFRKISKQ